VRRNRIRQPGAAGSFVLSQQVDRQLPCSPRRRSRMAAPAPQAAAEQAHRALPAAPSGFTCGVGCLPASESTSSTLFIPWSLRGPPVMGGSWRLPRVRVRTGKGAMGVGDRPTVTEGLLPWCPGPGVYTFGAPSLSHAPSAGLSSTPGPRAGAPLCAACMNTQHLPCAWPIKACLKGYVCLPVCLLAQELFEAGLDLGVCSPNIRNSLG
jgi:hypothetical protein